MDVLEIIIHSLTSDEVRRFKILSNRFKADEEKKLLILFDAVRSGKFAEKEDQLLIELYGDTLPKTKNRYYRLRNKLLDNIEKSLVFYHFKYRDAIHAYYDIQLAVLFMERGSFALSRYFLKKGEKKAEAQDQFNILEIIYGEYVELALRNFDINIEEIFAKRKSNRQKLDIQRQNKEALAYIQDQLKKAKFSKSRDTVISMLEKIKENIEENASIFKTAEGKILIIRTVSNILHQRGAFRQLGDYLHTNFQELEAQGLFNKENHRDRLLMRLRLIIARYHEFQIEEVLDELETFENEMVMYDKQNFQTYLFNYYNVKIACLKILNKPILAFQVIETALATSEIKLEENNVNVLLMSKAGLQFNEGDKLHALETVNTICNSPGYTNLAQGIRFYLEIFRIVLLLETEANAEASSAFKAFRKTHKHLLKSGSYDKDVRFLEILNRMSEAALAGRKVSLKSAIRSFVAEFGKTKANEHEIIDPELYLRSCLNEVSYHELEQEKVQRKSNTTPVLAAL